MTIAYLGLGSNLANPEQQIHDAIDAFEQLPHVTVLKVSQLYYSRPMGPQDQPDFMNAVISVETELAPIDLLDTLQNIEHEAGRIRKDDRWGPRVLDLDILLYGERIINTERLTVPHYGMKTREFVLIPLAEIAPSLILPDGSSVQELSKNIPNNQLKVHSKLR